MHPLGFVATEMDFSRRNLRNCSRARPKSAIQKGIFHFRSRLATHANRIQRPKVGIGLVVSANVKVTRKEVGLLRWDNGSRTVVRLNLGELKLGEDSSDPIKIHPELNRAVLPRLCVRVRNFFKTFYREHANAPNTIMTTKKMPMVTRNHL